MAVTNIMNSDPLYSCLLRASFHLPVEVALRERKYPVMLAYVVEHPQIVLHFIRQELRHGDYPITLLRFRLGDHILTVYPVICLRDGYRILLKIEIGRSQRQQLPFPDAAPIEHFKSVVGNGLVHHAFSKPKILLFRPEQHFTVFLLAHASGLLAGILPEVIIPYRMVEDGAELIVDGFQVDRGIGLAVLIPVIDHFILPGDDLLSSDGVHPQLPEIRHQLCADDMLFCRPGILFSPRLHILRVPLDEALESHIQLGANLAELLTLPGLCFPFCLESPLLRLPPFACPIGKPEDDPPGVGLLFFVRLCKKKQTMK